MVTFQALGTTAVVSTTDARGESRAHAAVQSVVAAFDLACSRFRADSELCAVNAAAGAPVRVGALLFEAITAGLRAARLTGGDVDPTVGQALIALGYDEDYATIARREPRAVSIASVPGWRKMEVDCDAGTVRLAPGVKLDLGATAKALAADHAAAAAAAAAGCGALVSLGGDVAVAGPPPHEGWRIRVTDDHSSVSGAPGQWVAIHAGGLATSSTTTRRWQTTSGLAHHLVDPTTGAPAAGPWRTVSAAAASCLDANIATTAALIRGERAVPWLQSLGLPSRLVGADGQVRHVAGWPTEHDDFVAPAATREQIAPAATPGRVAPTVRRDRGE